MNRRIFLLLAILSLIWVVASDAQTFSEVPSSTSGIDHVHHVHQPTDKEASDMSAGAAAGDFDGDGLIDLFVTRFSAPDILYRNLGNGSFANVSEAAGFTATHQTSGAAWGDIDNDGDLDLYATTIYEPANFLYINDGNGSFSEQAVLRNAAAPTASQYNELRRGFSVAFGDYDRDGFLDIHTTDWGARGSSSGGDVPDNSTSSRLLHNLGSSNPGYFEDTTLAAGVSLTGVPAYNNRGDNIEGTFSFASQFADMDNDGWADLVVAGDFHTSRLFWNNRDGTFTDGTVDAGVGTDENGMGSAVGDYNGDGLLDWFVTSVFDEDDPCATGICVWDHSGNRLYRNLGGRQFDDQTDAKGVRDGGWGWGATWLDYDNDGDQDLVMTNGIDFGVEDDPSTVEAKFNNDPMKLWRNDGAGTFTEVATLEGITDTGSGKGIVAFDYDDDGDVDLFVANNSAAPVLYKNNTLEQGSTNGWLKVETEGVYSNRDGINAVITVDPDTSVSGDEMMREIAGGSNFVSQNEMTAHFGLGDAASVDVVEIAWPSGLVQRILNVGVNQRIVAVEGLLGDFNGDVSLDIADIDDLVAVIAAGTNDATHDMTGDGLVNQQDVLQWLTEAGAANLASGQPYLLGDANLDGTVDGLDFIAWNNHKFTSVAAWSKGDFYADGTVDGLDFIRWNDNKFQAASVVPEPGALAMLLLTGFCISRRKSNVGRNEQTHVVPELRSRITIKTDAKLA